MLPFLYVLVFANVIYGVVQISRNKHLQRAEKVLWFIIVICMPVIGTALYLRATFSAHHGNW